MIKVCLICSRPFKTSKPKQMLCSPACRYSYRRLTPDLDRLMDKVQPVPWSGCWLWLGAINGNGYGNFWFNEQRINAHRASYMIHHGPLGDDLEIDHLCRVRLCVNPAHLEPITHAEHMGRSLRAVATHCARGHPYSEDNTRRGTYGGRVCLACKRLNRPLEHQKRREARRANALLSR